MCAVARKEAMKKSLDGTSKSLYRLAKELYEPLTILFRVTGRNSINITPIFHSLSGLGCLFFYAVMGQHIDQSQKVDFFYRSILKI